MYPYQQQQPYSSYPPPQQGQGGPPPPGGYGNQPPSYPPPQDGNYPYQQQPPAYPPQPGSYQSPPQGGPGQYPPPPPHGGPYGNQSPPPPPGGTPYGQQPPHHHHPGGSPYGNQPPPPGGSPYGSQPPPGGSPYGSQPPPGGSPYGSAPPSYPAPPQGGPNPYGEQRSPYGGYGQQSPYGGAVRGNGYGHPLNLTINSANNLTNVEKFGKQDPYVQFSTNYQDAQSFQKTTVANDAGTSASWNQSFTLPAGAQILYIEVMDKERTGFDEVIGFAAIPLQQASTGLNAVFEIYSTSGKSAGEIHLTFGQSMQQGVSRGQSYVDEGHTKRVKSLKNKATVSDVAVGGAVAIGVGLLAKHLYSEHEEHERREEYERYGQYRYN